MGILVSPDPPLLRPGWARKAGVDFRPFLFADWSSTGSLKKGADGIVTVCKCSNVESGFDGWASG